MRLVSCADIFRFWTFALGLCGCLVVGSNFVRVDLHVVARCSCCGAVIVGGLVLQLPRLEPRTSVKLLGGW